MTNSREAPSVNSLTGQEQNCNVEMRRLRLAKNFYNRQDFSSLQLAKRFLYHRDLATADQDSPNLEDSAVKQTCLLFALAAFSFCSSCLTANATELGVKDFRFTVNGKTTFLLGISYYGACSAPMT